MFFFFKQKTAYEMRIRDWSSDVCSSDLPSVPVRLAELMKEAGLPDGLLSVVHGDKEMVDAILDHPDIAGISFVGSSDIAQYIYARGTATGKRVQAFGGAKNHGIVMPDADQPGRASCRESVCQYG